jgi:hypothetical protein
MHATCSNLARTVSHRCIRSMTLQVRGCAGGRPLPGDAQLGARAARRGDRRGGERRGADVVRGGRRPVDPHR